MVSQGYHSLSTAPLGSPSFSPHQLPRLMSSSLSSHHSVLNPYSDVPPDKVRSGSGQSSARVFPLKRCWGCRFGGRGGWRKMFGLLFVGKRVLRELGVRLVIGNGERGHTDEECF